MALKISSNHRIVRALFDLPRSQMHTAAPTSMQGHPAHAMLADPRLHTMSTLHITDIEAAINWWRLRSPSPDGITACVEVLALAEVYALMVYYREHDCDEASMPAKAKAAWTAWYDSTPDAPCIAICSTSQGDDICKGCGRTFFEVQHWPMMSPGEKRGTWRRITMEGTAWRFNRYAERAREAQVNAATVNTQDTAVQSGS
jgi:uncharacterized protein